MSVQLVNDARRIAFYMEDDLHGIKQLAQAIFLIAEQIEYERCESILRIARIMMDSASTRKVLRAAFPAPLKQC